jgi:predicted nucleic acid-binding protein
VKWLLDTNVISETISRRVNERVTGWIGRQSPAEIGISAVTLAELIDGITLTSDEQRKAELTHWMDAGILVRFSERIVPVTTEILLDWIGLTRTLGAKGRPQAAADLLIASTCRTHNLILATRNVRDFSDTGITIYNPWTDETLTMDLP